MLQTKFQGHRSSDSREENSILLCMGIVASKETRYKIWLESAKWLLRKRSSKILNLSDSDQGQ